METVDKPLITYVMPTYNMACGIGEYAKKMFDVIKSQTSEYRFDIFPHNNVENLSHYIEYTAPDILHIHHEYSFFPDSQKLANVLKNKNIKIYITLHSLWEDNTPFTVVAETVTKVIVHAESWLDKVPNSIFIPMACDIYNIPEEDILKCRKKLGYNDDETVIVSNGFIRRQKGFERLVQATKILRELYGINAKLLIFSAKHFSGWGHDEALFGYIEQINMEHHVQVIRNYFKEPELAKWISGGDVIAYTYDNQGMIGAGCSASIKSVLSLNRPIIITDCSSFMDMGREVYRVNNDSPEEIARGIQWVLNNKQIKTGLLQKAKEKAIQNSWANVAKKHLNLYFEQN